MAQWRELLRLDSALQGRVRQLYEGQFPREIRHWLADWIESQDWDSAAADENKATACFSALLGYLEEQWNCSVQENNILQGPDFLAMNRYLVQCFQDKPVKLAMLVSECLKEEKKILTSATSAESCRNPGMQKQWRELDNKAAELKTQFLEVKKEIRTLESLHENLDFIQMTWQSRVEQNIELSRTQLVVETECLKRANFIAQTKQIVLQQFVNICNNAAEMVATLTDVELPEWKRRQQLACVGGPVDTSLDHLQKWFTVVAEVLVGVRDQLLKLQEQNKNISAVSSNLTASTAEIEKFALSLITKLLTNAMVVEKQPVMHKLTHRPLVLKTGVRFMMTARFLANLPDFKLLLNVKPVFDKDVEEATAVNGFRLFDFTKAASKVFDEDTPGGGLIAEFGHMSLKETKSRTKGACESRLGVTEELHTISFVTVLQHAGQTFNIETSSLPVVVISSSNQVSSAWASIIWWNMVSSGMPMNLSLFANPPPLSWQQLSPVLSWQFLSVGKRELDEGQLSMLRDKLVDGPDDLIHWSKFSKDEGAWIWIDAILDLISKHLADLWRDGSIMGFVSRQRTEFLLQNKPSGTFLIRFSESNKDGAITFSWVDHSRGEARVHAVQPYTKKELLALALPDVINTYTLKAFGRNSNPLLYLYPNIPKDTAFGRYYKVPASPAVNNKGYIGKEMVPISLDPTPPPSPPSETLMDLETDLEINAFLCQMTDELKDCLAELWPVYEEPSHIHLSPEANYADPGQPSQ